MNIKTIQHFKKLLEIVRDDGFLTALDYDYQITRSRHPSVNWFMEDVEYLKTPAVSWYSNNERVHTTKYYDARYAGGFGKERLVELILR
jgi:hypothetical protein